MVSCYFVFQYKIANLLDLIGFRTATVRLNVNYFLNALLREDVMAALCALPESQSIQ